MQETFLTHDAVQNSIGFQPASPIIATNFKGFTRKTSVVAVAMRIVVVVRVSDKAGFTTQNQHCNGKPFRVMQRREVGFLEVNVLLHSQILDSVAPARRVRTRSISAVESFQDSEL